MATPVTHEGISRLLPTAESVEEAQKEWSKLLEANSFEHPLVGKLTHKTVSVHIPDDFSHVVIKGIPGPVPIKTAQGTAGFTIEKDHTWETTKELIECCIDMAIEKIAERIEAECTQVLPVPTASEDELSVKPYILVYNHPDIQVSTKYCHILDEMIMHVDATQKYVMLLRRE